MSRKVLASLLILAALAFRGCSGADNKPSGHRLHVSPPVRVGDVISVESKTTKTLKISGNGKNPQFEGLLWDIAEQWDLSVRVRIAATESQGKPSRLEVELDKVRISITTKARGRDELDDIVLDGIYCVAERRGDKFELDPASIKGRQQQPLSPLQVHFLKQIVAGYDLFDIGLHNRDLMLMPRTNVETGAVWEVPDVALAMHHERRQPLFAIDRESRPTAGRFKLERVDDGIATVAGTIEYGTRLPDARLRQTRDLTWEIDLASHRIQREKGKFASVCEWTSGTDTAQANVDRAMRYSSAESLMPADGLTYLGWDAPAPDTSSYRNDRLGVSLDVPKEYAHVQEIPNGANIKAIAYFKSDKGIFLVSFFGGQAIHRLDDLVDDHKADLAKRGGTVTADRTCVLPGNIIGHMAEFTLPALPRKCLWMLATDGRRMVFIEASVPADDEQAAEEVRKTLQTLRLY